MFGNIIISKGSKNILLIICMSMVEYFLNEMNKMKKLVIIK